MNPSPRIKPAAQNPNPCPAQTQAPPLRERLRAVLGAQGWSRETVEQAVAWCMDYVVFHQRRSPLEMGALEVEQYLQHVRDTRASAVEEARQALAGLYRDVLGRGEAINATRGRAG